MFLKIMQKNPHGVKIKNHQKLHFVVFSYSAEMKTLFFVSSLESQTPYPSPPLPSEKLCHKYQVNEFKNH